MQKNFVVYKAGAGSGKTFTLVCEYLRLALHDDNRLQQNYRQILAVTFTNKAAAEMKTRVVKALDELTNPGTPSALGAILSQEMQITREQLSARSRILLTHLLHHYSDFAIGTIDSFTHKIVKTFAHELDLPVNFNVELDAESFYEKVVAQLMSRVGEDPEISRLLREFTLTRAEENASWDPEQSMLEFVALLQKENAGKYLEKLSALSSENLEDFHREFMDFMRHFRQTLRTQADQALRMIADSGYTDEDFIYKKSGPQNFFRKCNKVEITNQDFHSTRLTDAITKKRWLSPGADPDLNNGLSAIAAGLVDFLEKNFSHYLLCQMLSRQMYALMLLRKIDEISREQKQEERIVFISEFNTKIASLVSGEPAPFIYERLGERYHHYLIDEFQDTSSLQWMNLLPLIDNSLAGGWYSLVVGDGKQSIYRWRNANVRQFALLPSLEGDGGELHRERESSLERNFSSRSLSTNFRSSRTIVEFNNALFGRLRHLGPEGIASIYEGHEQTANDDGTGYITVDSGPCEATELEYINLELVERYISEALEDGFSYGEICILCRRNFIGSLVADHLMSKNLPVVSSDSLLLRNNLEVNTVVSYLRTLVNARDQVSGAAVLSYLRNSGSCDAEQLDHLLKQLSAGARLSDLLEHIGRRPKPGGSAGNITDLCMDIIQALDLGEKANQYLRFFLDEVNDFVVNRGAGLASFLEWWEVRRKSASLVLPGDTNAVRIMTIHASKGLEFPVVIIPYCNWSIYTQDEAWVDVNQEGVRLPVGIVRLSSQAENSGFAEEYAREREDQLLDNVNLLYVALTRAGERMHLICRQGKRNFGSRVSEWLHDFAKDRYPDRDNFFEFGERATTAKKEQDDKPPVFQLQRLPFGEGRPTIRVKSSPVAAGDAAQQGILLHAVLSRIRAAEDIQRVVKESVENGEIGSEEAEDLSNAIKELVDHPLLRSYYHEKVPTKTEADLATADGRVLRPDKVAFLDDHVAIIDYKTGTERKKEHASQLKLYEIALREMGHTSVKKLLVYLPENRVVEVN